jgi:UDP-N-acetyl-D-galactosamine dehydrogenase
VTSPPDIDALAVGVLGAGYVGLPLAVALSRHWPTVAFDIDERRIARLGQGIDDTLEVGADELAAASALRFSTDPADLAGINFFVVAVPTPIDRHNRPDLAGLIAASRTVGGRLTAGGVVVFESTVYPGATEETCVPEIEAASGLAVNRDFFVGYSPERANPGDRDHRLATIVKVTAGSTPQAADLIDRVYRRIVPAGTHRAPSIRVAEAAKVIENIQRDVNIALVNELAILFNRLDLDTEDVLAAARTKWNFLPFSPGFVGGHCIGIDPYYLTHKAAEVGHHPEMILAGRRTNSQMGDYAARRVLDELMRRGVTVSAARALVLGLTFKENTPDLRNTQVVDIVDGLARRGMQVDVLDPWASREAAKAELGLEPILEPMAGSYDVVVVAVAHRQFVEMGEDGMRRLLKPGGVIADFKWVLPRAAAEIRL